MSVINITKDNFEENVTNSEKPVLLDFWATWCGPCQMQGPVVEEAAEKYSDKVVFGKVNVDDQPGLAQQYGVMSIPTLVLVRNGEVARKEVGFHKLKEIEEIIS